MSELTYVRQVVNLSQSLLRIVHSQEPEEEDTSNISMVEIPDFEIPDPLSSKLLPLGLPYGVPEHLHDIYMQMAKELKLATQDAIRTALAKLTLNSRINDKASVKSLQQKVFEMHHRHYKATTIAWAKELVDLAQSCLTSSSQDAPKPSDTCSSNHRTKKFKRQFKPEYLPLFEFAFEKERFPSREDKKHLARISSMSYRQVNVWFQNRRCRQHSRAKSHRTTSTPKTFEEMKARLDPSARVALSESNTLTKKLNPDLVDPPAIGAPVLMQNSLLSTHRQEVIVLDDEVAYPVANSGGVLLEAAGVATPPGSNKRSTSLEAAGVTTPGSNIRAVSLGVTDDGFASDERDDSSDEDFLATSMPQRSSLPKKQNPLNPYRTPGHAFPTPYAPSQLTSNPFTVEHHPWLRDPRTNSMKYIDPTPEAVEEILDGFDHMDVDDPDATVNTTSEPVSKFPRQRIVSTGSSVTWSSGESTAASRTSSYSLSVRSSPRFSDTELASPTECITLKTAEYTLSPVAEKSSLPGLEAETAADSPAGDSETAGPSAVAWEERLESSILKDASSSIDPKWEALLAATS